jgi:uncharacterized protein
MARYLVERYTYHQWRYLCDVRWPEAGDLLQLTDDVAVILDSPEIKDFQGAERFWRFRPRQILYPPPALPLRWAVLPEGSSPNSLMTGSWAEVERRQRAAMLGNQI